MSPGDVVGSYEIEALLATGTTSTTYRARHRALARPVVLRVFHPELFAAEPSARDRARADAVRAAQLEHHGIAAVYDAGPVGDGMFVASALVEGPSLADEVAAGRVTPSRCAEVVAAVADALAAAHRAGVVHGEVRPEAIVLGRWGNPVLRDFGVTRWSGRTGLATRAELLETLRYAAPERVLGRPADAATDLYGLAATALACLTGRPPVPPDLPASQLLGLRTGAPPPRLVAAGRPLPELLASAMAVDPADRPALAPFAAQLSDGVAQLPAELREAPSPFALDLGAPASAFVPHQPIDPRRAADVTRIDRVRDLAPAAPAVEPSSRRPLLIAAALVATATLAAFGIGRATAPGPPAPVQVGTFRLSTSPWWTRSASGDAPVRTSAAVQLAGSSGGASVGLLAVSRSPRDPLAALPRDERGPFGRSPALVRAGARELLRYAGATGAVAFALPTSRGTLVAQCDAATPAARCAALLTGAALAGARPVALVPAPAAIAAAAEALRALEVQRGTASAELTGAPSARAGAASQIAGACRTAAESVTAARAPELGGLRAALVRCATAYDDLSSATDRRAAAAYRSARGQALAADRALIASVRTLADAGFPVGG